MRMQGWQSRLRSGQLTMEAEAPSRQNFSRKVRQQFRTLTIIVLCNERDPEGRGAGEQTLVGIWRGGRQGDVDKLCNQRL